MSEFVFSLPSDLHCEKYVLSSLMNYTDAMDEVSDLITEETFHKQQHKDIFKAISSLADKGLATDFIAVTAELQKLSLKIDLDELLEIEGKAISSQGLREKACWLEELSRKRQLWQIAKRLETASLTTDKTADEAQESALRDLNEATTGTASIKSFHDILSEVYQLVSDNLGETKLVGVPTGFQEIDRRGGFQLSDMVIIAAESSVGKTSFAIRCATSAARRGFPVAFYSLEMTARELGVRIVSAESSVNSITLSNERLDDVRLEYVDKAIGKLDGLPIFVDEKSSSTIDSITRSIRTLAKREGIKGAFIDYLQILSYTTGGMRQNKEQFMGDCARRLKNLAKELNIFIVALSQLNRPAYGGGELSLHRLRDSGQIGEAADMVLMIDRPELRNAAFPQPYQATDTRGKALVKCVKGRKVGVFSFLCGFNPTFRF